MSIGRDTLKATMRRTWNAIKNPFRRRTNDMAKLQDDYPCRSDSEFTDDEERRREWLQHLHRRATIANEGLNNVDFKSEDFDNRENDEWEYVSEYNVSFPSDSSIIDAYKEKKYDNNGCRPYIPPSPIEEEYSGVNYTYRCNAEDDRQRRAKKKEKRRTSVHPNFERLRHDSFSIRHDRSPRECPKSDVKQRVNQFEKGSVKRRDSAHPQTKMFEKLNRQIRRRESSDRESSDHWIDTISKKKVRKQLKQRKRAKNISSDDSDVESVEMKSTKYTVNITMNDLHDIIKKNVTSAVKTIVSTNTKEKSTKQMLSPAESFSTESETIFSGSSSHSTDANLGGLLQKQIKAQLDKDKLKGLKRTSVALGNLHLKENDPIQNSYTNPKRPSIAPILSAFNQQQPHIVVQESPHLTEVQKQHVPQVTFDLVDNQQIVASEFDAVVSPPRRSSVVPSFRRPSIVAATIGNIDMLSSRGQGSQPNQMPQLSPSICSPFGALSGFGPQQESVSQTPFHTVSSFGISPSLLNGLKTRRHTLAALDTINPSSLGLHLQLDQPNNILNMLDTNVDGAEKAEKVHKTDQHAESGVMSNTDSVTQDKSNTKEETTRPLTIAEQIEVLTKKKPKKPLKEGQMGLTGCVRAMLILTNIMFLLVGAGSMGVGVWMLMDPNIETYFDILNVDNSNQDFKMICYIICSIGGFLLFIGFMGSCGAIKSSKCMLTAFIVLTAVITLTEGGLGAMLMLQKDSTTAIPVLSALLSELGTTLKAQLTRSVVEKYNPETTLGAAWDLVQVQAECCGSNGPDDYKLSAWKNATNDKDITLPDTCCVLVSKDAQVPEPSNMLLCQAGTTGFFHDTGCFDALLEWFKKNSSVLAAAIIAVVAIEIFSLISAIVICRKAHTDAVRCKNTPGIN